MISANKAASILTKLVCKYGIVEAAKLLGIAEHTLRQWQYIGIPKTRLAHVLEHDEHSL